MLLSMFVSSRLSSLVVFNGVRGGRRVALRDQREEQRRDFERGANEEPIVVTVRMQGMLLLAVWAILIFGFTSFSATFVTCVSIGAGVCVSHSVMKAPLTREQQFSRRRGLADESVVIG